MSSNSLTVVCVKVPIYFSIDLPSNASTFQIRKLIAENLRQQCIELDFNTSIDALIETTIFGDIETTKNQTILIH